MFQSQPHSLSPAAHGLMTFPGRQLFASHDLDETRAMVGRIMKPHLLDVDGMAQRLDSRMHHVPFGDVSLCRLKYGAAVHIDPGPLEDFYLVQMPLAGSAHIVSGGQEIDSTPDVASVLSAAAATTMHWGASSDQIMVRIARPRMDRALEAQLGRPLDVPLEFQLDFRWRESTAWRCLISYLLDCSAHNVDFVRHKLVAAQIEQLVVATLLSAHSHNYSNVSITRCSAILPRHVRRVQDYLQSHAHEPVHPEELAKMAGVSLRSLYTGFKDFCGVSPMQYLKNVRLDRARVDLLGPSPCNVTGVALRWGFTHMGRFSADYKTRFGESPNQTLRQA